VISYEQSPHHLYRNPGIYSWKMKAGSGRVLCTRTGTVEVTSPCTLDCTATVPAYGTLEDGVLFQADATPDHCTGDPQYLWNLGGFLGVPQQSVHYYYPALGTYFWGLTVSVVETVCAKFPHETGHPQ
jgi:hypothetical protein